MADICTDLCTGCIDKVDIPNCGDTDLGKSVVKIFIQKNEGAAFIDYPDLALEASWITKMAITDYNVCDDRIISIGDLHEGTVPDADQATETAPYGGDELVNMTNSAVWKIKRFDPALVATIDKLRCLGSVNFWFLTNRLYLFGGITGYTNTSIKWGNYAIESFDARSGANCVATWVGKQQYLPIYADFLKTISNPS